MKTKIVMMTALFLVVLVAGCGLIKEPSDAKSFVDSYYATIKNKEFDKTMSFYSEDFFTSSSSGISAEEWKDLLTKIQDKLGDFREYRLTRWSTNTYVGTGRSGTYYSLQYNVTYSHSSAVETLTVFKPPRGSSKDLRIMGHNIQSPALLK